MVGKLYKYKGQTSKVYCIHLEYSGRIIRVRDAKFVEDYLLNTYNKSVPPIYKAIFKDLYTNQGIVISIEYSPAQPNPQGAPAPPIAPAPPPVPSNNY